MKTRLGLCALLLAGCTHRGEVPITPPPIPRTQPAPNREPKIAPLFAARRGHRVRLLRTGDTVTVRARATDPDGDVLRYRWRVTPGGGTIDASTSSSVRWIVGASTTERALEVLVRDGRGGFAHARLLAPADARIVFAGRVVDDGGKAVDRAEVTVNGDHAQTDREGRFRIEVRDPEAPRFLVTVRAPGRGLISRVYDEAVDNGVWSLPPATTVSGDPTRAITAGDTRAPGACPGGLSSRIDWSRYPQQRIAQIFNTDGTPLAGPIPDAVRAALAELDQPTACGPGISIAIPPASLVDAGGAPPSGSVEVTLSTVDLRAPDAMPGDYTVRVERGRRAMQSWGAGTVTASRGGRPLALAKGATATLTIPIDPLQLKRKQPPDSTIPLLVYEELTGEWTAMGTARLAADGAAYVAKVSHLSSFNTDLIKTDQSCVKIESSGILGDYQLEVTIPTGATAPTVKTYLVDNTPETLHAIYNLPSGAWIAVVPIREDPPGTFVPLGTFVVNTGPPQVPTDPNRPDYPYDACQSRVSLVEVAGEIRIVVDGSTHRFGPLPVILYALTDPSGNDVYPLGPSETPLLGLFDTGSTRLAISNLFPNRLTASSLGASDAGILGLGANATVNVRLNGLAARRTDGTIPIGPPGSGPGQEPQWEMQSVLAESRAEDVTLVGVPIIHQVAARIDYTKVITDPSGVVGPDITFFQPPDPTPGDVILTLQRWGTPQRFMVRGVTFQHGGATATENIPPTTGWFFFDTGTTATIIGNRVANALGLVTGMGSFDCFAANDRKGYEIDAVEMTGTGGTYRVEHVSVCWDPARIQAPAVIDAVIGSNLFDQLTIVFDGMHDKLGIVVPPGLIP